LGEDESYIVPIFETFVVEHAITNFEITGEDLTKYYKRLLQQEKHIGSGYTKRYLIGERNRLVYVALDPDKESIRIKGENGKLVESSYLASECIFKPILVGKDSEGLDGAIISVLSQSDVNFRRGLCNNIVVYGPAVFRGLSERLKLEIQKRFQGTIEVNVTNL
jgi:actin-related protein